MALDDRIRTSVDHAIQALVADLTSIQADDVARQVEDTAARLRDAEQARSALEQRLADAEARHRSALDAAVLTAVEAERARLTAESAEQVRALQEQQRHAVAEAEARAAAETRSAIDTARAGEREAELASMARLLESIRGLDGASSLSEVLDALALAAGRETSRAAVVVIKGDHAVGWRLSGFGPRDAQPKSVDLPLADAGVIGLAVTSSRAATTRGGDADGPGFEPVPDDRIGLAMPVLVGGRAVAVVYADGASGAAADHAAAGPWAEAIEVLARHAGRCLEALTAQKVSAPVASRAAAAAPGAAG
jgi:hypothetical protein